MNDVAKYYRWQRVVTIGNIDLKDYVELAKTASKISNVQVVWTFGPDDLLTKEKTANQIDKNMIIFQPPSLLDFCDLMNDSKLLVSTSTGPMHLAGALNIKTISFFGDNLFASAKRWASVNNQNNQHNITISQSYDFDDIKNAMVDAIY